jgi:hypothetical protein
MPISQPQPDAVERAIRAGQAFGVTQRFDLQNGGDTFSLVLEVPSGADSDALVFGVAVNVTGQALIRVVDEPTEDTQGATKTPNNRRVGSSKAADSVVRLAGTNQTGAYSGGAVEGPTLIGGEAVGARGVPAQADTSTLSRVVPTGARVQLEVEADQNARSGSLGILFAEGEVF